MLFDDKEMKTVRMRLWLLKIRFLLFLEHLVEKAYNHLRDVPEGLRYCVVVTCNRCGGHAEALEGYYDHAAFQCLHCNVITDKVTCKMEVIAEAKAHHHPAYVLM